MDMEKKVLRISAAAIGFALLLRLFSGGLFGWAVQGLSAPETASWLLFFGTGRLVRTFPLQAPQVALPPETQPPAPAAPAVFTQEDAALVEVVNYCGYSLDIGQMLTQPLSWDLTEDGPAVLIVHSHGSESYENTEGYEPSGDYRTLDERYNMISIGQYVAQRLEEAGIRVIHDRTAHDYPSYSGSYENSRASIRSYLEKYPSIRLVLDLHRDAAQDSQGNQIRRTVSTQLGDSAKVMVVVGSPAGGQDHPGWRQNMALGVKLHAQLEKLAPGLCYEARLRSSRFNQDLSPGALLVEVGAAGNTRQEALIAAEYLSRAVIALAHGTAAS